MSDTITILEKLGISSKVNEEIKTKINVLYVFRDCGEKINVIIVTVEDMVYCFGPNQNGVLGFGHNNSIKTFIINEELSNKNITDFKNSDSHTIARTTDGKLFSWGTIRCSENKEEKDFNIYKPQLNKDLNKEIIIDMCCSKSHSLVLTSNKIVYVWSHNQSKRFEIRNDYNEVPKLNKSNEYNGEKVKMISSGFNHSLVLTDRGHVFSWGHKYCGQLSINYVKKDDKNPKGIQVEVIIEKISCGPDYSLLLSDNGNIYVFCRDYSNKLKLITDEEKQLTPIKLNHSKKFNDIAANYRYNILVALSVNNNKTNEVHNYYVWGECGNGLIINEPRITQFKSFDDIFLTLAINNNSFRNGEYTKRWKEIFELGEGSYGKVSKVGHKFIKNTFFAMKKIPVFSGNYSFDESFKELDILSFLKEDNEFLVKYHDGWFEQDFQIIDGKREYANNPTIYIQMDLCKKNLSDIQKEVKKDGNIFSNNLLTNMGYLLLSEMFVEILEGVKYLHSKDIMHRDLHPDNILVKIRPNGNCIKIADFGYAKIHIKDKSNTEGKGRPRHMAPEVGTSRNYDTKADIYSLGIILSDLFDMTSNNEYRSDLISKFEYLEQLCGDMTHTIPRKRLECNQILDRRLEWTINQNEFNFKEELFNFLMFSNTKNSYVQKIFISKLLQKYLILSNGICSDNWVKMLKTSEHGHGEVFQVKDRFCDYGAFPMKKESLLKILFIDYSNILQLNSEFLVKHCNVWIGLDILDVLKHNNEFLVEYHDGWCRQKFLLINGISKLTNKSTLYIQMDLCDKTLEELNEEIKKDSKLYSNNSLTQLGYYLMSELFIEILKGLKYLHKNNIIHRDLNPYNILVKLQTNGNCIKIEGFNLELRWYIMEVRHCNYVAPEVLGSRDYDTTSDINCLGLILEEMFDIDFIESFKCGNDFPCMSSKYEDLVKLSMNMTDRNPQKRPNCEQILDSREKWAINESEFNFKEELNFLLGISHGNRSYVQNIIISKLSHIKDNFYLSF